MQSALLRQLLFALSSLLLSDAQGGIGLGHLSCLRSSPGHDGQTRVTFLREDAAAARSLYRTVWSADLRLLTCRVHSGPTAAHTQRTLCDRGNAESQEITRRFNLSVLDAPDAPCARVSSGAPNFTRHSGGDGTEVKVRRKRGWMFPGTLWCGKNSEAVRYEHLGMFENADRCCREHDHCMHTIPSFTVNYGVFNSNFYTLSHCDCDQRFRQCLLDVNDTISTLVGYSFFSILRIPCFELKLQKRCTKMHWWGMCKVAKEAPYAIFQPPLPYNTSDSSVTSKYGDNTDGSEVTSNVGQHVTEGPVISSRRRSAKSQYRCRSRDPPRGDTFHRRKNGRGCKTDPVPPSQTPPISKAPTTTPSMANGVVHAPQSKPLMSNKKRLGKKRTDRKGLLVHPTQRSNITPQVSRNSNPKTPSTTRSNPSSTKSQKRPLHVPTAITALNKSISRPKDVLKQSCCRETNGSPIKVTTIRTLQLVKTTDTPGQDPLNILWNTATSAAPITTQLKTTATLHKNGKPQRQTDSHPVGNNTSQKATGKTKVQSTHVERSWDQNNTFSDNQHLCGSLKLLDECEHQIPPLEKKYDLQNMDSKTAYHCDCTTRLAVQIKNVKQVSILPRLLMDFVSQYCFRLQKEKKCHRRKSCSGGFIKASDLLRALKKTEGKYTARVQNAGIDRKRIPVRLYKRCRRLDRETDIMAQLT